jgi:hypothetical protein
MEQTILKDVLIDRSQIEKYYEGSVPVNLWRGVNKKKNQGIFDFVEEPFMLSNGRPRPADIEIRVQNGVKWVLVKNRPRGVSTFDKPGIPCGKDWEHYRIPRGTILPDGLAIVRDEFNSTFGATHYTIAPSYDMPLERFKSLLNKLAARVLKEAV